MKKIKLLTPILGVAALVPAATQVLTSCGVSETNIIPESLLDIDEYTLKGIKADSDLSKYTTLVIPNGIKYIDDNAFADKFVTGGVWSNIQNVVFPTSLREIRYGAFKGCTSLRVFDFTEWTVDQIYYLDAAQGTNAAQADAFDSMYTVGNVYTSDSITKEARAELEEKLTSAGLSPVWFTDEVTDRLSADDAWKVQTEESGVAHFKMRLNVQLPANTHLVAYVTKTGGTDGIDIECNVEDLEINNNLIELPVSLLNQEKTGDKAEFDITVVAVKVDDTDSEVLWKQTLTGFSLTNVQPETVTVREIRLAVDDYEVTAGESLNVYSSVYPKNAENKTLVWTSSNEEVATVDQTGKVTGVTDGVATITATAKDTGKVSASVDLRIKASGIQLDKYEAEYYEYYVYADISKQEFEEDTKYTFVFDSSKFKDELGSYEYYFDNFVLTTGTGNPPVENKIKDIYITYQNPGEEEKELDEKYYDVDTSYSSSCHYVDFDCTSYYFYWEPGCIFRITIEFDTAPTTATRAELSFYAY